MEAIRILHMIGSLNFGGSQTMVLNLYRAIDRNRVQFDFVLDHPHERALADQVEMLGAKIYIMPPFNGKNFIQIRRVWDQFFREHPEYKILHSHVRSYASVYLPIAKKHGIRTIIHSHNTSNGSSLKALLKAALQYPLRYQADYFFSCSEEAGKWLFGEKIVYSQRHTVLKNSIDVDKYRYNEKNRETYRQMLGLTDKYVCVNVARFHPQKNHIFLLNMFSELHQKRPESLLLLVGDGEMRSVIESQIREMGLEQDVILLGNRNDIPQLLQAADVFLFPSLWEGLGIVAVEAQAAGLSCVCSDNVPKLAKVTENCVFLPLQEDLWVKECLKDIPERIDTYNQIVSSGYDIHESAKWLQEFYLKIHKEDSL